MAKTISTHNGSAAHRAHNIRAPWATDNQEHIDKSLRDKNEILHDEKPREAYQRIFGAALEAYNAKQTRPERMIQDYYAHIEKDAKKHPVYEMIAQIGNRQDTGIDAPVERECLKEFYLGWKERNPNLECIGAYIHADETDGTLHMHIDYVPVATGYKRGMEVQSGLVKALEQQGFTKHGKDTAQIQWEARENAVLEQICNAHGIEIIHPQRTGEKLEHLDTQAYKLQQECLTLIETKDGLEDQVNELHQDITEARESLAETQQQVSGLQADKTALEGKVSRLTELHQEGMGKVQKLQKGLERELARAKEVQEQHGELKEQLASTCADLAEAQAELAATEAAIKEKRVEAQPLMTREELARSVQEHRAKHEAEKKQTLLAKFAEFVIEHVPGIRQLWEQFIRDNADRKKKHRTGFEEHGQF